MENTFREDHTSQKYNILQNQRNRMEDMDILKSCHVRIVCAIWIHLGCVIMLGKPYKPSSSANKMTHKNPEEQCPLFTVASAYSACILSSPASLNHSFLCICFCFLLLFTFSSVWEGPESCHSNKSSQLSTWLSIQVGGTTAPVIQRPVRSRGFMCNDCWSAWIEHSIPVSFLFLQAKSLFILGSHWEHNFCSHIVPIKNWNYLFVPTVNSWHPTHSVSMYGEQAVLTWCSYWEQAVAMFTLVPAQQDFYLTFSFYWTLAASLPASCSTGNWQHLLNCVLIAWEEGGKTFPSLFSHTQEQAASLLPGPILLPPFPHTFLLLGTWKHLLHLGFQQEISLSAT